MPPRTRAQLQLEAVTGGGWAALLEDLLPKILEALQADDQEEGKPQEEGLGFSKASAVVRQVCAGWQAVHDALVTRLVFERRMDDEAVGMLVRRFPAVVSVQFKGPPGGHFVTDEGVRAVCSSLPALTSLNLTYCINVTDEGVRAVCSSLRALTSLNLFCCTKVTDEGVRAVSGLRALTSLNLFCCIRITNAGVLALSSLHALAHLDLRSCLMVTAAGVQALRSSTAAASLHIQS
jgi:hypothetical protein